MITEDLDSSGDHIHIRSCDQDNTLIYEVIYAISLSHNTALHSNVTYSCNAKILFQRAQRTKFFPDKTFVAPKCI